MRKALVAVVVVLAMALPAFAANPFVDVPQNHWAYDALSQLSAKGVIQGYPDGTFKGQRPLTRYEFAVAIAKMLANVDATKASKEDVSMLKKLVVEFKDELDALGVKVDELAGKVDSLQKGLGGWKFSGEFRFDYKAWDDRDNTRTDKTDLTFSRARLVMTRQIDDKVSVTMRFNENKKDDDYVNASGGWDRFFVTAKMPYDITMRIGKFNVDYEDEDGLYADNDAIFLDYDVSGYELRKSFGMGELKLLYTWEDNSGKNMEDLNRIYGKLNLRPTENLRVGLFGYFKSFQREGRAKEDGDEVSALGLDFTFSFKNGSKIYGIYANEDPDIAGAKNTSLWKLGVSVPQKVLGITAVDVEVFNADENAWWDNPAFGNYFPVMEEHGAGESYAGYFVKLTQEWNPSWTTWVALRSGKFNVPGEDDPSVTDYEVAVRYNYTKNMYMELLYENADYNAAATALKDYRDDSVIRFRTYVSF